VEQFSSGRAFEHLKAVAQVPSPTGSNQNASVRDYIIGQIEAFGLTPEIQSTTAVHPEFGTAFRVENVLARLPGSDSSGAVLIVGHYDGVASGPGIGDNRITNAAMLEAIRALRAREPLRNDVIFFFADAEEYGLVGASAFLQEHPWARDVRVVFNFDSSTGRGPAVLMNTAEDDGWLVSHLAATDAGIFLKSQQNSERGERWGQDFDVFEEAGYTAANINNWTNTAFYHSRVDNLDYLDERKLQAFGVSMVQLANHFGNVDLGSTREGDHVFTSVFGKNRVVHYASDWTWPLTLLAAVGVVGVVALGVRRHRLSLRALLKSGVALLVLLVVAALLAELAWGVIKGMHPEARWQQDPEIYQGRLLLGGLLALVVAVVITFLAWSSRRLGVVHLQAAALALLLVIAFYAASADPLFSYLALWPLLAITAALGLSLFVREDRASRYRWLRAAFFWLAAVPVLGVFVPLLAQVATRTTETGAAVPALVIILLAALLVSLLDLLLPAGRYWAAGLAVAIGVVLLAVGFARSGFNADQPRPHTLFYALNADTGSAQWATLDDDPDAWLQQFVPPASTVETTAEGVLGIPASTREDTDWLIPSIAAWASAAPVLDAPAPNLEVVADRRDGEARTLAVRVTSPRSARVVYVVSDREVTGATVEGKSIAVQPGWRLMFVGVPADGVELELVLPASGGVRLTVLDQTDGIPTPLAAHYDPEPAATMPAILPRWARGYPAFVSKTFVFD